MLQQGAVLAMHSPVPALMIGSFKWTEEGSNSSQKTCLIKAEVRRVKALAIIPVRDPEMYLSGNAPCQMFTILILVRSEERNGLHDIKSVTLQKFW